MSEQTEIKSCCVSGHIHEGQPLGKIEVVYGLRTYISNAKEAEAGSKQDVVIFIPDIFGIDLVNTKLVADEWATKETGWKVLLPDVFEGTAIDGKHLKAIAPNLKQQEEQTLTGKAVDTVESTAALGPFLVQNREAIARPRINEYVKAVKNDSATGNIAIVGFCWGARYAYLLARDDSPVKIQAAVGFHPSFVTEDDLKDIKSTPIAVLKGTKDAMCSEEQLDEFEKLLKSNLGEKLLVKRFPEAVHGFAVRGDDKQPREKGYKEEGAKVGISFVQKAFGGQ